ncbi:MAG TPA: hypothetical protein DDW67_09535 [Elusimicrobia bacterium]|jgi:alanine dehydrogenase|nr:hypothetical protein [Elusimicrobiota bacterium]
MRIGIAAESRHAEKRVIIEPPQLGDIAAAHEVLVESGAGKGIGISDGEYERAGAKIAAKEDVYGCELVVRLKEPEEEELRLMVPGSTMMSMLHLKGSPSLDALLKKYGLNSIALEELKDPLGRRMVEASYQAGLQGMKKGFELWGGDPKNCSVKIMGYGKVAFGAIQYAARMFARIEILNKHDTARMGEHIPGCDILVNAIDWPYEKRGKVFLINRGMLKLFKKGAVIADLISNPAGQSPIETMHPTFLDDIAFEVDGVTHTSCWSWPGLDPEGVSRRYSIQVAPILKTIADLGLNALPDHILKAYTKNA